MPLTKNYYLRPLAHRGEITTKLLAALSTEPALYALATLFCHQNSQFVSYDNAVAIVEARQLEQLQDRGHVLIDYQNRRVELPIPLHLEDLNAYFLRGNTTDQEFMCLGLVYHGFITGSAGGDAGRFLKRMLGTQVFDKQDYGYAIKCQNQQYYLCDDTDRQLAILSGGNDAAWNILSDSVFYVKQDKGLDFAILDSSTEPAKLVVGQLKTGHKNLRITAGSYEAQSKAGAHIDDGTFAGILIKAQKGIASIRDILKSCFPNKQITVSSFYLCSTKDLNDAAQAVVQAQSMPLTDVSVDQSIPIPYQVLAGMGLFDRLGLKDAARARLGLKDAH
jgi:hypothetical protein